MMRRVWLFALTATGFVAASVYGCGDDGESLFDDGSLDSGSGAETGGSSGLLPSGDSSTTDGSGACTTGKACGDGGVCAGNVCCEATLACGDVCCGNAEVCSYQKCVTPGAVCRDSNDCATNEYCEYTLGTATDGGVNEGGAGDGGGADASACIVGVDRTGRCLPRPPVCAADAGSTNDAGAISCVEKCEFKPTTASFTPVLKYSWGGKLVAPFDTDIMHAPIVIELDDDDCDGKITERDIPEIVFSTFQSGAYEVNGVLHAISLLNGTFVEKWQVPNALTTTKVNPTKHIAAGNFDGKPGNEVVACGTDSKVHAFRGSDGAELWATTTNVVCFMPSIADLDGDGAVEVIVEGAILNGADGTIKKTFTPALNGPFVISDLDSDGKLDIVTSSRGYHSDGTMFVDTAVATTASFPDDSDWKGPWAAVGDFDLDGKPEVVAVDNEAHQVLVWRYDAAQVNKFTILRQPVDINALFVTNPCGGWGATHGGGPPTVADFDKDGVPDVGLAGGIGYVVFDGKKLVDATITNGPSTIMWAKSTIDCSSASTGSTVFDFNGDGKAEVVYSDEKNLRIYEGATGNVLADVCNTTATLSEFPIVADVDNDGHADIVVVSNAYAQTCTPDGGTATKQAGIRVFGDTNNSWVRTRRVWNEHAYHITNVNEDGTIPQNELANWKQSGLNNFRQNKQPGSEFAAPNLVASLAPLCPAKNGVTVTVRNVGEALVPAGVVVGVYSGSPPNGTKLGTVTTTRALYPAESEPLDLLFANGAMPPSVYAIVDDGAPAHPSWTECRTDDNLAAAISIGCNGPN
jgi:hypothetical protein